MKELEKNKKRNGGKWTIKDTRLTAGIIIEKLRMGESLEGICGEINRMGTPMSREKLDNVLQDIIIILKQ